MKELIFSVLIKRNLIYLKCELIQICFSCFPLLAKAKMLIFIILEKKNLNAINL
jgi:hypothetical protein